MHRPSIRLNIIEEVHVGFNSIIAIECVRSGLYKADPFIMKARREAPRNTLDNPLHLWLVSSMYTIIADAIIQSIITAFILSQLLNRNLLAFSVLLSTMF